jgi:hypothetical protein
VPFGCRPCRVLFSQPTSFLGAHPSTEYRIAALVEPRRFRFHRTALQRRLFFCLFFFVFDFSFPRFTRSYLGRFCALPRLRRQVRVGFFFPRFTRSYLGRLCALPRLRRHVRERNIFQNLNRIYL